MTVVGKVKTGVKGAIGSPARFLVSLGIGFAIGVIADLIMEYVYRNFLAGVMEPQLGSRWEIGFPFYYAYPELTSIAWDDVILLVITMLMLFSKRFVTTLGFFLGWYVSTNIGFYQQIEELPQ